MVDVSNTKPVDDQGLFLLQKLEDSVEGVYGKIDAGEYAVVIHSTPNYVAATQLGQFIDDLMQFEPGSDTSFFDDPDDYSASFFGFIGEPFSDDSHEHLTQEIEPLNQFTSEIGGVEKLEQIVFGTPCPACGEAHRDFRNLIVFEGCLHRHDDVRIASAEFYHAECRGWIATQLETMYDRHADTLLPEVLPDDG